MVRSKHIGKIRYWLGKKRSIETIEKIKKTCAAELRYEVNNGIALCQFHHPRKRADEQRLILTFQGLVGSVN